MGLYEGIKDVAKIVQQADNIELYRQLLDLSAQALEMQNTINKLTAENDELKKKKNLEDRIQRHQDLYLTLKDEDDTIIYCSHCWDNEKKLIQLQKYHGEFSCHHCRLDGYYNKTEYNNYCRNHQW